MIFIQTSFKIPLGKTTKTMMFKNNIVAISDFNRIFVSQLRNRFGPLPTACSNITQTRYDNPIHEVDDEKEKIE